MGAAIRSRLDGCLRPELSCDGMSSTACSPVDVQRDGRWHPGTLEAWRRDVDGWRAFVRYSVATGMQHLEWVTADRVRPA